MIRDFPAQAVDADFRGELPRAGHFLFAVVPLEEDVAPVDVGHVPAAPGLLVGQRTKVGERDVELAALAIADVGLL